jgi:hypothetical protein
MDVHIDHVCIVPGAVLSSFDQNRSHQSVDGAIEQGPFVASAGVDLAASFGQGGHRIADPVVFRGQGLTHSCSTQVVPEMTLQELNAGLPDLALVL